MLGRLLLNSLVALLLVLAGCTKQEETSKTEGKTETTVVKVTDPVCGMQVEKEDAIRAEHRGKTYYFCSEHCKQEFLKEPAKYPKEIKIVDPVCGMKVGHGGTIKAVYRGETYYFCSSDCKDEFENEPEKFLKQ